jgi:hypothetical protein
MPAPYVAASYKKYLFVRAYRKTADSFMCFSACRSEMFDRNCMLKTY